MKVLLLEGMGKAKRSPNYHKIKAALSKARTVGRKIGTDNNYIAHDKFHKSYVGIMKGLKKHRELAPRGNIGRGFKWHQPNTGDMHARARSFDHAQRAGEARRKDVMWGGGHKWNIIAAKRATNRSKRLGFTLP